MFVEQINGQNIKIKFDVNEKQLLLGDVLKITASGKNGVLVQVIGISTDEKNSNFNVAESKILFTIDNSGKLVNWQGNVPSQDFMISRLSAKEVLLCSNTLEQQNPVPVGTLSLYPGTEVNIEAALFEKPTVIYCDTQTQKDNILNILSCELSKNLEKTVLIDFNGSYSDLKVSTVLEAGKDIKLPFDLKGLELFYNRCFSGTSPETRAIVENVFMEIENYLSSDGVDYIPFNNFRQAVDAVYEAHKLTGLVLLKNKLLKLQKSGVFADKKLEINSLYRSIVNSNLVIVDLSKFTAEWQRDLIEFIIDSNVKNYRQKFFLLLDADKINADKLLVEKLCINAVKNGISPVIITGHESEAAVSLLSYAANIIAFAPENTTRIAALKDALIRLKDNEAVLTGKITNNVPLYVNIYDADSAEEGCSSVESGASLQASPEIYLIPEEEAESRISRQSTKEQTEEEEFNYSNQFEHDESGIELIDNISRLQEADFEQKLEDEDEEPSAAMPFNAENRAEEEYDEDYSLPESGLEEESNYTYQDESLEEAAYGSQEYDNQEDEVINVNSNNSFYDEDDDFSYSSDVQEDSYSTGSQGSSFYDAMESENTYSPSAQKYDSGFSEDDLLNFVDDNVDENNQHSSYAGEEQGDENFDYGSNEEFQDESVLDYSSFYDDDESQNSNITDEYSYQQDYSDEYDEVIPDLYEEPQAPAVKTKPSGPPVPDIPVYSVPKNNAEIPAEADFQEGDKVSHEKYGVGVITKIIGSSEKRLCSIQFDDAGRRLLDPKLAELKKV